MWATSASIFLGTLTSLALPSPPPVSIRLPPTPFSYFSATLCRDASILGGLRLFSAALSRAPQFSAVFGIFRLFSAAILSRAPQSSAVFGFFRPLFSAALGRSPALLGQLLLPLLSTADRCHLLPPLYRYTTTFLPLRELYTGCPLTPPAAHGPILPGF